MPSSFKVRYLLDEAQVRPGVLYFGRRVGREPLQVGFIYEHLLKRDIGRGVALPVECVVHHDGLRHDTACCRGYPWTRSLSYAFGSYASSRLSMFYEFAAQRLGIRVDQQLVLVEPHAVGGLVPAPHLVAVHLPGLHALHEDMPYVFVRPFKLYGVRRLSVRFVEQQKVDFGRVLGVDGEVDAFSGEVCSKRVVLAGGKLLTR